VRRACIDIGSNTTRLLVADCHGGALREVHQERVFTRIGRGLLGDGTIGPTKIVEVAEVVAAQLRLALELGAEDIHGVATAAIRHAGNGGALVTAISKACGLAVEILSGEEEARLAFVGAARTLGHVPDGTLGVVDVGGGSSELVVGFPPDQVSWCASFAVGSGDLADQHFESDPPSQAELDSVEDDVAAALAGLSPPRPAEAVAVGGSAASLCRLAGRVLDGEAFTRSLSLLASESIDAVAGRFDLDRERVRLLPAGLIILRAASRLFDAPLQVGSGGIREGVLLEAAAA
jgi:exopolyphosphatase/guanosine-5'-triphosphate,3'-diphosphate pyrophosphatase